MWFHCFYEASVSIRERQRRASECGYTSAFQPFLSHGVFCALERSCGARPAKGVTE